ncbi:MAG: AAA family ATPase [Campylobacterota bacterium]|nr:AAA family ATPase [Campylobacterota bacterium]
MIERFYMKSCLSFDEVELELNPGLIVFSGASGSGKSVLMRSILASVGLEEALADVSESSVTWQIDEENTGCTNEESNVLREVKKEKVRYFFNNQSLPKAAMRYFSKFYLRHLSLKDYSDFDQPSLLGLLDQQVQVTIPDHINNLALYQQTFEEYKSILKELDSLKEEEKRILDLRDFAAFEVEKIDKIAPEINEYENLMKIKKALSLKEKAEEKIARAEEIFQNEYRVSEALQSLDIDSGFFDDAMNELRVQFDSARTAFDEVEDVDIEEVLDRLEQLSDLKRRYGSIEEALEYREQKADELEKYDNFEAEKEKLQHQSDELYNLIMEYVTKLSLNRAAVMYDTNDAINSFLKELYLKGAELRISHGDFGPMGQDIVELDLQGTSLKNISSGEFNRLRLALLAVKSETMTSQGGVLMLDEIDANLSGEESMSVAKVLRKLSKNFQIFVISHQPQLTAMGEQHFLVGKDTGSYVSELNDDQRIEEIARMISGDTVTQEALGFAKEMLESAQCAS